MENFKTFETWLPLFPGFYNTNFEADEGSEINNIVEEREDNSLNIIDDIYKVLDIDYSSYYHRVSKECCSIVEDYLNEIGLDVKIKMDNVYSPREYNFTNDSINITITFNKGTDNLQKLIYNNKDEIASYIKAEHTSRSGFISFHSNKFIDWEEETCHFTVFEDEYILGALLEYLLNIEGYNSECLNSDVNDVVQFSSEYIKNYQEATEDNYCWYCEKFHSSNLKDMYVEQLEKEQTILSDLGVKATHYTLEQWKSKLNIDNDVCPVCQENYYGAIYI